MSTRIEKDFVLRSGVHFEGKFLINEYKLTLSMIVETEDVREQAVAMERIEYFLSEKIENSIIVNKAETKQIELYKKAGLSVVTLPEEPYDQILGMVLLQKLNSILEKRLIVTDLLIGSFLSDGVKFTIISEIAESLLENNGWYVENSLNTNDIENKSKANNIVKLFQDQWVEIGLTWREKKTNGK